MEIKEVFVLLKIKNYEVLSEKYSISNYGKIYDKINYRFVKLSLCGNPKYYYVTLTYKGRRKTFRVNRLVALCFISNPDNLPVVDHIDRNRLNNYTGNLRWVTRSKNQLNSNRIDKGNIKYCVDLCNKFVNIYNKRYKQYRIDHRINYLQERIKYIWKHEYTTQVKLSKRFKISVYGIPNIVKGIKPKERKPIFSKFDTKRYYLRNIIREKYLGSCKSRKRIVQDLQHLGATQKIVATDLKGYDLYKRKTLSIELKRKIYDDYISGTKFMECVRKYGITKSMTRNIKNKFKM